MALIDRPVILWSVNKLTRAVLARLISYVHSTSGCEQFCHVGEYAKTVQTGIVSRFRICWRPRRLPVEVRSNFYAFSEVELLFKPVGCANSKRQCHTVQQRSCIIGSWSTHGRNSLPGLWCLVIEVLHSSLSPSFLSSDKPEALRLQCEKHPEIRKSRTIHVGRELS